MSVKEIVQLGAPCWRKVCDPILNIEEAKSIINDLKDTLATVDGIGLAAPQIGVTKRVIYINFGDGENEYVLINPKILAVSKEVHEDYEGCISYVMHEGLVERPIAVKIETLDEHGEKKIYEAQDLLARCFMHEIDHLDGIMYVDRASEMYELVEEE